MGGAGGARGRKGAQGGARGRGGAQRAQGGKEAPARLAEPRLAAAPARDCGAQPLSARERRLPAPLPRAVTAARHHVAHAARAHQIATGARLRRRGEGVSSRGGVPLCSCRRREARPTGGVPVTRSGRWQFMGMSVTLSGVTSTLSCRLRICRRREWRRVRRRAWSRGSSRQREVARWTSAARQAAQSTSGRVAPAAPPSVARARAPHGPCQTPPRR